MKRLDRLFVQLKGVNRMIVSRFLLRCVLPTPSLPYQHKKGDSKVALKIGQLNYFN